MRGERSGLHHRRGYLYWWLEMMQLIMQNSTTVIEKIKEMPRSLFYYIPCYVTIGYEKWYTTLLWAQCEKICAFEIQNHVNYM